MDNPQYDSYKNPYCTQGGSPSEMYHANHGSSNAPSISPLNHLEYAKQHNYSKRASTPTETVVSPNQTSKSNQRSILIILAVIIVANQIGVAVGITVGQDLDENQCLSSPCIHGTVCFNQFGGYICDCEPGYTGLFCENDNNETSATPDVKISTTTTTTTIATTTTISSTTTTTTTISSTTTTTTKISTTITTTTTGNVGIGFNSSNPCTNPTRFKCLNPPLYECIPFEWHCDGINDCGDGSDEIGCDCNPSTQFNCHSTPSRCISRTKLCDGWYDCPLELFSGYIYSSWDEIMCSSYCYSSEVRCEGMCIPKSLQCKGYNFCADHREDRNCACTSLQTQCNDRTRCIEVRKWCDGLRDCRDGSDEAAGCTIAPCPNGGRRCPADNSCINPSMICDRINDCPDGSDEKNCSLGCRSSEFKCNDGKCIDKDWTCDGKKDCLNGEDEKLLSCYACNSSQYQCSSNKACVAYQSQCDGTSNCNDGSDEAQCVSIGADGPSNPGNVSTPVEISYKGQAIFPLCADNWSKDWSDFLCEQIGYKESQETSSILDLPNNAPFLKVSTSIPPSNGSLISVLSDSGSCSTNRVVGVSCKLLDCGVRGVSDNAAGTYIINGQVAARGAWPWQVFLEITKPDDTYFCGGSLINDRWILTAAHCVEGLLSASNIKIQAGSTQTYSTDPELLTLTASSFIQHPLFADLDTRNVIINDVALIQLSSPVTFTATIRPICLAPTSVDLNKFKVCVATGWGKTRSQYVGDPSNLRQGKMKLRTTDECYRSYTALTGVTWQAARSDFNYFVCAGNTLPNGGVDTCQGDSGGPLACQDQQGVWTLVGVTSFGFGTCDMSVFSRVSYFNPWINTQMQS